MAELFVFNPKPDEPHPPATGVVLTEGQEGGGAGMQVEVEPSTLPWPEKEDEGWSDDPESRTESARQMGAHGSSGEVEVEKWEDEESDGGVWDRGDGSLADEEEEDDDQESWMPEKAGYAFNPLVTIVLPPMEQVGWNENTRYGGSTAKLPEPPTATQPHGNLPQRRQPQPHPAHPQQPQWIQALQQPSRSCCQRCSEAVRLTGSLLAAAVIFPLLVWAGFKLLPFDSPPLSTAALRLVYTLRCAFFATFPIVLGMLVQGVSRLKFGVLRPLYTVRQMGREVVVHGNYVRDSLHLYILYFIQLAVTATYIDQDMLKLVPLLTIIFVFGRLIYWTCVSLGSSVRALGFGLSFFPLLALLGVNLYFVCSSTGLEAVFDVAPPPPPLQKERWWG